MRRTPAWLSILLVGSVVLGACSGDDDSGDDGTAPGDDTEASVQSPQGDVDLSALPSEDELQPALLTLDEMPFGWSEEPPTTSEDEFCDAEVAELLGYYLDDLPTAEATYAYDPELGPSLFEAVGFVPEGTGPNIVPAIRAAFAQCSGGDVGGVPATITEMSFPTLGDDSAAFMITVENPETGQTFDAPAVYMTSGDLMVALATFTIGGKADAPWLLQEYAPRALDKAVGALLDQHTTPTPLTEKWPPAEAGNADLAAVLLSAEDLPASWSAAPPTVTGDPSFLGGCVNRIGAATRGMAEAETTFAVDPGEGPQLEETIGRVGDHGTDLMAVVRQVMAECDGSLVGGRPISIAKAPLPGVGDDAQAYRIQFDGPEFDVDVGAAYVLTGDLVIRLHTIDLGGDPIALLEEYAPRAVDKARTAS